MHAVIVPLEFTSIQTWAYVFDVPSRLPTLSYDDSMTILLLWLFDCRLFVVNNCALRYFIFTQRHHVPDPGGTNTATQSD